MSVEPKAIVGRCFEDIIVRGETRLVDEIVARDLVFTTATGDVLRGRNEFKYFAEHLKTAFPDICFEFEEEICEGERVCTRYTMRGTFLETLWGVLPTGNEFGVRGADTFRVVNGQILEIHAAYDTLGQTHQLETVPRI